MDVQILFNVSAAVESYFNGYLCTTGAGAGAQGPPVGPLGLSWKLQMGGTSGAGICGVHRRDARPPERFGSSAS